MAKVHIILELVLFNPCFLCLLPTYGVKVIWGQRHYQMKVIF